MLGMAVWPHPVAMCRAEIEWVFRLQAQMSNVTERILKACLQTMLNVHALRFP